MNEVERLADQLARAHDGDAWYGAPTRVVLRGITPEQAARRPISQAHNIWEIVLHITSWQREVLHRLRTGACAEDHDDCCHLPLQNVPPLGELDARSAVRPTARPPRDS